MTNNDNINNDVTGIKSQIDVTCNDVENHDVTNMSQVTTSQRMTSQIMMSRIMTSVMPDEQKQTSYQRLP